MGGELLLLALGGCFMSNLIAKARDVVDAGASDPAMVGKLMTIAARGCIVHNTLAPGVKLSLRRA